MAIDLKRFIEAHGLDTKEVAVNLFPGNKYPTDALRRITDGTALLDEEQISKLATMAGVSLAEVFDPSLGWSSNLEKDRFVFTKKGYRAILDRTEWMTYLYHGDDMFHKAKMHDQSITLKKYLADIDLTIAEHEFGAN